VFYEELEPTKMTLLATYVIGVAIIWTAMWYASPHRPNKVFTELSTAMLWPLFVALGVVSLIKLVFWGRA